MALNEMVVQSMSSLENFQPKKHLAASFQTTKRYSCQIYDFEI